MIISVAKIRFLKEYGKRLVDDVINTKNHKSNYLNFGAKLMLNVSSAN